MKLWNVEVHILGEKKADSWLYPAGTANVAVSRLLRYNYLNKKEGLIRFKPATDQQIEDYIKDHPNGRLARSMKK